MPVEPNPTEATALIAAPDALVVIAGAPDDSQQINRPPRTLENYKKTKKAGKIAKGIASQITSALASVGGWSDSQFFKYLANQPGAEAWISKIPASTSDIRLILRNILAGGSSGGIFFSDAVAENNADAVQNSIIAAYTSSIIFWFISTVGYASTHGLLRYFFPPKIADASVTYFDWGQIGNLPAVLMTPMTTFAMQAGALKMALFANVLFRFAIPALSYLFVVQMGMGVTGVDLANGIAPLPAFLLLLAYMHWNDAFKDLRQWSLFKDLRQWSFSKELPFLHVLHEDFTKANKEQLRPQLWKGVLMMTQRGSEYLNVSLEAEMLEKLNEANLGKMNPFLQTSPFCTLAALGLGTIGNVDTREKRTALFVYLIKAKCLLESLDNDALVDFVQSEFPMSRLKAESSVKSAISSYSAEDLEHVDFRIREGEAALKKCEELDAALRLIVRKTFLNGAAVNLILTLILVFLRNQITDLFASSDMTPEDYTESSMSSLWNALGLVPDALRIIASNLNNTYEKIGTPNAVSLALMTLLGIFPLYAYAQLSGRTDIFMPFFWVRDGMMLLSAGIIVKILYNGMDRDTQRIQAVYEQLEVLKQARSQTALVSPRESEARVSPAVSPTSSGPRAENQPGYASQLLNWVRGKSQKAPLVSLNNDVSDALERGLTT